MTGVTLIGCRALFSDIKSFNAEHVKAAQTTTNTKHHRVPPVILVLGCLCFIMYGSEGALLSWTTVLQHKTEVSHQRLQVISILSLL